LSFGAEYSEYLTFYVERLSEDASTATTFYVDKCYLQRSETPITHPTAWSSCFRVNQFHDGGTYNYYVDVTDIPGDVESLSNIMVYRSDSAGVGYNLGFYIANSFVNTTEMRVFEIEDWTDIKTGSWTTNSPDSNASASSSITLNDATGTIGDIRYVRYDERGKFKVLLAYKITDTSTTWSCKFETRGYDGSITQEKTTSLSGASTSYYRIADLGAFSIPASDIDIDYTLYTSLVLTLTRTAGTGDITLDCIYLIPTSGWLMYVKGYNALLPVGIVVQNEHGIPQSYMFLFSSTNIGLANSIGTLGGFMPNYLNRLVTLWLSELSTEAMDLEYWDVLIKYVPRTSFLLGAK